MIRTITVLTIAGFDSSGDADIQADLKAVSANGAYAMSVITALTAQSTRGVTRVHAVPLDFVRLQLDTVLASIRSSATRIGMLATAELAALVVEYLPTLESTVLDPVMVATSGNPLLGPDARTEVRRLCTLTELITSNLSEAAVLLECKHARNIGEMIEQTRTLRELGIRRALVKGGHLNEDASDVFTDKDEPLVLAGRKIATQNTHGTGCTLSSTTAALRPRRHTWVDAMRDAKTYLTEAVAHADSLGVGHEHGPIHHFHAIWPKEER